MTCLCGGSKIPLDFPYLSSTTKDVFVTAKSQWKQEWQKISLVMLDKMGNQEVF